jgi:hypothetical protein
MNKRFKGITAAVLSYVLLLCLLSPLGITAAGADQGADIAFDFEDGTAMGWAVGWGQFAEEHPIEIVEELAEEGNRLRLRPIRRLPAMGAGRRRLWYGIRTRSWGRMSG